MAIDWNSVQENAGGNYKQYAADGDYKVKVSDASIRKTQTETVFLELSFVDSEDWQFPKISHAISFKNDNWRLWHFMNMLKELGISEEKAKAAIETIESKSSQDAKVSAYEQTFKRATAKHPEIDIEVFSEEGANGKIYARADFKNRNIAFGRNNRSTSSVVNIITSGEEIDLGEDIPF